MVKICSVSRTKNWIKRPQKSMTFLQASLLLFCRTVFRQVGLVKWAMWVHREPILHVGLKDQKSTSLNQREKQKKSK